MKAVITYLGWQQKEEVHYPILDIQANRADNTIAIFTEGADQTVTLYISESELMELNKAGAALGFGKKKVEKNPLTVYNNLINGIKTEE